MRCFAHRAAALLLHHPAQSWDPLSTLARHPVDLLHVDWPARDENDIGREWSRSLVQLDLTPKTAGGQDILDSGTCEGSVEVRARNADAVRTSSRTTGTASGQVSQGCGITPASRPAKDSVSALYGRLRSAFASSREGFQNSLR
jgi:hypothetical protein